MFCSIVKLGTILTFTLGIDRSKENGYNIEVSYGRYFKYICTDDLPRDAGPADTSPRQTTATVKVGNILLAWQPRMQNPKDLKDFI